MQEIRVQKYKPLISIKILIKIKFKCTKQLNFAKKKHSLPQGLDFDLGF
jgi:hypothetical protein